MLFVKCRNLRSSGGDSNYLKATTILYLGLPILSTLMAAILYTVGGRFLLPSYGLLNTLAALGVAKILLWAKDQRRR